jgi:uncharacterized protein (TIGR03086 family)
MALSDRPADRHREVGRAFMDRARVVRSWDVPSPVAEWTARDVVRHLTDWFPSFLAAGSGIQLPAGPSVDSDPVGAWQTQYDAVQALLDDPAAGDLLLSNQHIGEVPLHRAIDNFYTADVFMHTWDLARATGQDDRLDADFCAQLLAGMEPIEEVMRSSGQYGARVPVRDDADAQTKMLGFIGRDPQWTPSRGRVRQSR